MWAECLRRVRPEGEFLSARLMPRGRRPVLPGEDLHDYTPRSQVAERTNTQNQRNVGKVIEIRGVVIDALIAAGPPEIYTALKIERPDGGGDLIAEVQQHLGDDRVRAVAMDATDGIPRGVDIVNTGAPITVPVGKQTLGRLWNVLGDPIDDGEPLAADAERWPIHRDPPSFDSLQPTM